MASEKDCYVDLTVVAIGGGAGAGQEGGSGSGYVETATLRMSVNSPLAAITVGQADESSKVEIDGELVLEALPGQSSSYFRGGDGYSGGGAMSGIVGETGGSNGSDGGNSTSYPGGKGSGFDLGLLSMKTFILTPGAGGQPRSSYGGGGGGVVVNGKVPGLSEYRGLGFGGGAAYSRYVEDLIEGFPGCVLVEI